MGNPVVRADAGRFPHRMAARIAGAIRSALFRGEGGPSPAALRAASAREGLSPPPADSLWTKRPARESVLEETGNPTVRADAGRFPHRWRPESLARSGPPSLAGREDPPRTPPRRRCAPRRLSPPPADSLWTKRPARESILEETGNPTVRADAGRFPHRWRPESLARSGPPSLAGREDPPRTPPRRRFAPRRLSPPPATPDRRRDARRG